MKSSFDRPGGLDAVDALTESWVAIGYALLDSPIALVRMADSFTSLAVPGAEPSG